METIKVALIGFGYWGPNLARNIISNNKYKLVAIIDQDKERRELAKHMYGISTYTACEEMGNLHDIDLAVICTRPSSHKFLASFFIENHINVLIMKPCGISSHEADEIALLGEKAGVKVFCDFTYHYSPLVNFLTSNPKATRIVNEMSEYISYRTSLGIVQSDVDVIADLAVHDIYILLLLKSELPVSANCLRTRASDFPKLYGAFITLNWSDGFTASIHVSWNSPRKVRLISISSENFAILLEEMKQEAPIQLVNYAPSDSDYLKLSAEERYSRNVSFTMGDLEVPQVEMYEALAREIEMIAHALTSSDSSLDLPTARSAVMVWRVVEALRESDRRGGVVQNV